MPTSARRAAQRAGTVWMGVDPAHHVWPGGGEPHFPMQLCHVGYGHAATHHNLGGPSDEPLDAGRRAPGRPPGARSGGRRRTAAPEDLTPEEQAQLEAMQAADGAGPGAAPRRPGRHGGRQPRHGPLRAGRPPPHAAASPSWPRPARHRRPRRRWSRGWRAGSARTRTRSGRRSPSSGPPTSRSAPGRGRHSGTPRRSDGSTPGACSATGCGDVGRLPATHARRPHLEGDGGADLDRAGAVEQRRAVERVARCRPASIVPEPRGIVERGDACPSISGRSWPAGAR